MRHLASKANLRVASTARANLRVAPTQGFFTHFIFTDMKYLLPFLLLWSQLLAQSPIVSAEWFIDNPDPGFGNATSFDPFASDTAISAIDQVGLSGLTAGVHFLRTRVKDDRGIWSHTYTRPFLVLPRDTVAHLVGGEWFWNNDPGLGQGQPLTLNGADDTASWSIDLSALPAGVHDLYIRAKNAEGIWGHTYRRHTFIRAEPNAPIEQLTYYYAGPDSNSATFTYTLSQPLHYVDISFDPDAGDLKDSVQYDFCVTAVRTDSVESFERCVTFLYRIEDTTSTQVQAPQTAVLNLYPNPNQGRFSLELPAQLTQPAQVQVFDAQGRKVWAQTVPPTSGTKLDINLSNPAVGIYFVAVEAGASVWVKKVKVE